MDERSSVALAEGVAGLLAIAAAMAFYWDSLSLAPSRFDPLGSAAVPRALCLLIVAFAAGLVARVGPVLLRPGAWARSDAASDPAEPVPSLRPGFAAAAFVLTIAYVALFATRAIAYAPLTAGFVLLLGGLLAVRSARVALVVVAMAVILGYGGAYLFTRVFLVDLP